MNILVGCEESQTVTKAFRAMGHTAFSCDLQEYSGGHPEWHIQKDVFDAIEGRTLNVYKKPQILCMSVVSCIRKAKSYE